MSISVSAYILAGGMSRRFGEDKALYDYQGKPLIQHVLDHLAPCFSSIHIITKDPRAFASLGYPVIRDLMEQQTPLVGLLTGLQESDTAWNFFTACDLPFLTGQVSTNLLETVPSGGDSDLRAVIPVTKRGMQPLVGCYHKDLVSSLRRAIARNQSVKAWLKDVKTMYLCFDDELPFRNINRKEDLDALPIDG